MHWLLQDFEDTHKLAVTLDRLGLSYSWHKVVPFVGDLLPEPSITEDAVILFGSYSLWRFAQRRGYHPGVYKVRPFLHEAAWQPSLLNGADSTVLTVRAVPTTLRGGDRDWFVRPVSDNKEIAGAVRSEREIVETAMAVLALDEAEVPAGSLRHDTLLMLSEPTEILKEWRVWIVDGVVVTGSLYREGRRVTYRSEIDDDALNFAREMAICNPGYAPAYVLDVCKTASGLKILETNCINAAGFYAADLAKLAMSLTALAER